MQSQSRKSLSRSSQLQIWSEDKDSDDDFTETSPFSQNGKKIALKKQTTTRKKNKFKLSMKQPAHSEPKTSRSSNDLKEIQRFQKYPGLLVPKSSFTRVVRDVLKFIGPDLKIQSAALGATQAASETFLTNLMEGANLAAVHAKRVTIMPKDVELYQRLKQL
ncbi:hypothetical protein TCAL_00818 [Tigriopus californicus]|uniref:Core Histone H2A/H2B/H3 domain-containing protein n=1 Tax=Tigriopus californicus TaxID=6832 RepID=A0A553NE73_TIGCA|nr:hypothetical protein TCAL_00818 [Tigriopus californicus]|eukprot:TCALIF_00818-PA protein Name:"Similar to H3f3c Histone H3.3C (Mus musculus)" AED:0.06 eAED:0.06 QI:0/-1/0/1/-1/1/1/0/161